MKSPNPDDYATNAVSVHFRNHFYCIAVTDLGEVASNFLEARQKNLQQDFIEIGNIANALANCQPK